MNLHRPIVYYAFVFFPLFTLVLLNKLELINPGFFTFGLLTYALLYHPFISGKRLISLKAIEASNFKYNFIPLWNLKYFDILFFKR